VKHNSFAKVEVIEDIEDTERLSLKYRVEEEIIPLPL